MRRRAFITLLAGAAAWPLAARAQRGERMRRIGVLIGSAESDPESLPRTTAFENRLAEIGWMSGRNVRIDYRWAGGDPSDMQALAKELVASQPDVILASSTPVVAALVRETRTIPIVFVVVSDPIGSGFVASLSRPGGNVTGASFMGSLVAAKQIGLLRDTAPRLATIGLLVDPLNPMVPAIIRDVQTAAQGAGLKAVVVEVKGERDIDAALAQFVKQRVDALGRSDEQRRWRYHDPNRHHRLGPDL
jgi:putative tryptophan/tyrosine transport system substrate-binding protein